MLVYKMDVLNALKEKGYNTYVLRKQNILGQGTIQYLRNGNTIGPKSLDVICELLECQPGDILEWVPEKHTD